MFVGVLLPVVALPAIWYLVYGYRTALGLDRLSRRGGLVVAFIVMQLLVAVISEGTSAGRHFTTRGVGAAWLLVDIVAVFFAVRLFRRGPGIRPRLRVLLESARATTVWERILAGLAMIELAALTATGWLYNVPNTADSLVYHLTRVAYWVQNGSVHHYPVHYAAENELSPLHEYNMAHLHLLTGTDRLDGFVQLLAVIVCVVGASEVARLLGGDRRVQVLAAALTATIPSLILEATSTQNNVFAAGVFIGFIVLLLAWRPNGRFVAVAALVGAASGAAILTKGTLGVFIAATGVVLVVAAIVRHAHEVRALVMVRRVALVGVIAAAVAIVVAGPFFARNLEVYGSLTGPISRTTINYDLTPEAAAANIIRSVAGNFQIGDGSGPQTWIGEAVRGGLHELYLPLGIDVNDWRYMVGTDGDVFRLQDYSDWQRSEAIGANPWHVILIIVALVLLLVFVIRGDKRMRVPLFIALALVASFLIFTGLARWSPYAVRYLLPVFVAFMPLIALALGRVRQAVGMVLAIALFLLATPQLLDNGTRSLLNPLWDKGSGINAYYRTWDGASSPLRPIAAGQEAMAAVIADSRCTRVGLANRMFYEYPFWVALKNTNWHGRIDHVAVQDPSKSLMDPDLAPCARVREIERGYVTVDPDMVAFQFGSMALAMDPSLLGGKAPGQAGFRSDVPGVQVRPGAGWILGDQSPSLTGDARVYVFSPTAQTLRLQAKGVTSDITGWQRTAPDTLETPVAVKAGVTMVELRGKPGNAPLTALTVVR